MKRAYEITYILPAGIPEEEQKAVEERVSEWITAVGGELTKTSHWGRRRLAFNIGPNREGYYIYLEANIDPEQLKDFDRRMTLEQNIIRYLVVRTEE